MLRMHLRVCNPRRNQVAPSSLSEIRLSEFQINPGTHQYTTKPPIDAIL
jgi:hypothetical protein